MKKISNSTFVGGGFLAAIAASLCCILPVVSIALGIGAFGVASVFETLRPYLLVVAFAALGFAFYLTYFRREACEEGQACETKPIGRVNQLFLWVATFGIIASSLFPFYTGYLVSALGPSDSSDRSSISADNIGQSTTVTIEVEGMTCEGCASHIDVTLKKLKGVISAKASYKNKNVKVVYDPSQITLDRIKKAINDLGYVAK